MKLKPVYSVATEHEQFVGGINTSYVTREWFVTDLFAELLKTVTVTEVDGEYVARDAEGNIGVGGTTEEAVEDYVDVHRFTTLLGHDRHGNPAIRREHHRAPVLSYNQYPWGEAWGGYLRIIEGSDAIRDWWHLWEKEQQEYEYRKEKRG